MARELWAKIAVEIIRDPKLVPREPWERWLWLGLICLTKEMTEEDGILRGYDARALASVLDLRVAPSKVRAALEAFAAAGMVVLRPDNAIELLHFKKRQWMPKDSPEAVRKRQQEWRAKHKGNGAVTGETAAMSNGSVTGQIPRDITGSESVTRNAEEEEEEEKEEEEEGKEEDRRSEDAPHAPPPPPPSPPAFTTDALVEFIAQTWTDLPNSRGAVVAWRSLWPSLDLLSEAKAARAKEVATGQKHASAGGYLQSWFKHAAADAAERKTPPKAIAAGPIAPPLTPAATSRMLDEKDRGFREEKARKGDVASRQWLRQRWPETYPEADDERWKGTA